MGMTSTGTCRCLEMGTEISLVNRMAQGEGSNHLSLTAGRDPLEWEGGRILGPPCLSVLFVK